MPWLWIVLRRVAGAGLVLLGIVGLFLPVLQGVALIIGGAVLLGFEWRHLFALLEGCERRIPWTARACRRLRDACERWRRRHEAKRRGERPAEHA